MHASASRAERKRLRNRDALVGAARALFATRGFEGTTIADIAEAADLGFGTFYRYFPDKESVLEAVLDEGRAEIDAVVLAEEAEGASPAQALVHLSERFVVAVRRNRDVLLMMWQVAIRKTTGRRPLKIERAGPEDSLPALLSRAMQRIIERGMAAGDFASGDAELLARLIGSAHMYLLTPPGHEADERLMIATLCEFELRALGASGADGAMRRSG
jgi:AcrR family transcriptional regulator